MSRLGGLGAALKGAPGAAVATARSGVVRAIRLPASLIRAIVSNPKRSRIVLGGLALVLAAATALFSVLAVGRSGIEQARVAAMAAAEQKVPQLLSYDYRTVEKDQQGKVEQVAGAFHDDYASLMKDVVVPAATKSKLTTRSTVVTSSVVSADSTDAVTMLMFVNQTSSSEAQKDPQLAGSRLRVTMDDVDGDWKISAMTPV